MGKDRIEAGQELQKVLDDQLAVEAAYKRFVDIVYPDDAAKQEEAMTTKASPDQMDCELAARKSFIEHGAFDSFTGFSMQFHQYIVNICADVADTGANIDVAAAAKQACTETATVV